MRVAGNVLSHDVMGSFQYAGVHLETSLFVILRHDECGAVKAALATKLRGHRERSRIQALVDRIVDSLPEPDPSSSPEDQLASAVEANVRATMRQVLDTPEGKARQEEGRIKLVGAICDITTGKVRILS